MVRKTSKASPKAVVRFKVGEPWELPELDHERKLDTIAEIGEALDRSGLPHIAPDGWSAAYLWWTEVFTNKCDPIEIAEYAFGATPQQLMDTATEFGRVFRRMLIALKIEHSRRVGRVKDVNYTSALDENGFGDRKLFLQAHAAEYVPTQKVDTKGEVTIKGYVGIDPEEI